MGKLRVLSGQQVCRILENHGFQEVQRRTDQGSITLPVPDHSELALGTLLAIIRQSGVARSAFES